MILKCLYIFLFLKWVAAQNLLGKLMPNPERPVENKSPNNYVPLFMIKGPEIVNDYHFRAKQMVKRQVAEDEQTKKLLESFGGTTEGTTTVSDKTEENNDESAVTINPKSGFYYLIDWNTFVEVDNQNGKRINFRLEPKYGDPKRFFSVTVP